jgi:hypothetical protein
MSTPRVAIADLIRSVLPNEGFGLSIGDYVRSDAYTFLIAFPDEGPDETLGDAIAVVVFSHYELPMANRTVLGVDALAIRAETLNDAGGGERGGEARRLSSSASAPRAPPALRAGRSWCGRSRSAGGSTPSRSASCGR